MKTIKNQANTTQHYTLIWIQIILVLVIIFSRYWSKSIIRAPLPDQGHQYFIKFHLILLKITTKSAKSSKYQQIHNNNRKINTILSQSSSQY